MAKLKQQRRRRQRGRQKSGCFRLAKQQLCTRITLFCTFLCRICTTTTWNCLILLFREEVNKRRRTYSLSKLEYGSYKFNSRSVRLKWVRIILIKTERTQIHFWSDDFAAVASSDRKVQNLNNCGKDFGSSFLLDSKVALSSGEDPAGYPAGYPSKNSNNRKIESAWSMNRAPRAFFFFLPCRPYDTKRLLLRRESKVVNSPYISHNQILTCKS